MKTTADQVEQWFTPARFGVLTACLIAACFPGVLAGRDTFFFRDFAIFSYPLAAYHKASFWSAQIPLWNPYNDCGLPFLAQWNTMVLYPFSIIYLLFPLSWSLPVFCLIHMWFGGMGMYCLARAWTKKNSPSTLAGLGFLFGGVMLSCLKWPNNIAALGWMPWVVLSAQKAVQGDGRALAFAALIGALQMLTGAPEIIVLTWGLAAALWLSTLASSPSLRAKAAVRFPLLVVLVSGIAAAQLLPFLDLLRQSQRDDAFRGSQWPMPPWGWANFILPLFRMFPSYHNVHAQPGQYWISTYYVSIAIVLLAIVALTRKREGKVWLLGAIFLFSIWMALGKRALLYQWMRATVPGLGMMRFPIKFIVLAAFVLPLLGSFGLQHLLIAAGKPSRTVIWFPALILGSGILGLMIYSELNPFPYSHAFLTSWNGFWRIVFLLTAVALLSVLRKPERVLPLLMALIVADSLSHTSWQNPVAPRWVYETTALEMQPAPQLGNSRAMISPEAAETVDHLNLKSPAEDVMASRLSLYCNLNLLEPLPKVDGFFAIYPRDMSRLQDILYTGTNRPPEALMDFLGVSQLTAPDTWKTWEPRSSALPLVTSPTRTRIVSDPLGVILTTNFNPRAEVLLKGPIPQITTIGTAQISALDWKPQRIAFQASADSNSIVVISQTFYHWWQATIDGQPAELNEVNGAFQGLRLAAGTHQVLLTYRDLSFRLGSILSFISLGVVAILWRVCKPNSA